MLAEPIVYDGYNQKLDDSGIHRSLRVGRDSSDFVAQPMLAEPVAASFKPGASAKAYGIGYEEEMAPTLESGGGGNNKPAIIQPYSFDTQFGSNANVFTDLSPTLKASQQSPSVTTSLAVRRLTPLECERLMGWPDDHTRWTDEGKEQADTHRYKQCGNGVAAPVAQWIAGHLNSVLLGT